MNCDRCTAQLDTYLDGELSGDEMREVGDHVRACPACAAGVLQRVQVKRATSAAGRRYTPRPELRRRVEASIRKEPQTSWRRAWVTAAALALLLLAFFLGYERQQRRARQQMSSELADLHVATLASASPVDVISSDRHTVKPWFQGRIPFTFNLPELQDSDFVLLGGRVVYFGQEPGAELIYQIRKHRISVFLFQERAGTPAAMENRGPGGFSVESWRADGLLYVVMGDAGYGDIHRLSEMLKTAARG